MADRRLSVDEITDYLGISRDTVYTWLSTRGLPGRRIGRLWKFKRDEVRACRECGEPGAREPRGED